MRYVITGGSGYIGTRLVDLLSRREDTERIVICDVVPPRGYKPKTEYERLDGRDRAAVRSVLERSRADVLVHLAFILTPSHDEHFMYDVDVNGTHNVLEAAADAGTGQVLVDLPSVSAGSGAYRESQVAGGHLAEAPGPLRVLVFSCILYGRAVTFALLATALYLAGATAQAIAIPTLHAMVGYFTAGFGVGAIAALIHASMVMRAGSDLMRNLYVGNLSFCTTEEDLAGIFSQYGQVERVHLVRDRETSRSRGFAFVEMPNDEEADKAIQSLHGADLHGRTLTVNEARPKPEGGGGGGGGGRRPGGGGGGGGGRRREPRW